MLKKKKAKVSRFLAVVLAILLVAYNIPFGAFTNAFAEGVSAGSEEIAAPAQSGEPGTPEEAEQPGNPGNPEPPGQNVTVMVEQSGEGHGLVKLNDVDYAEPITVKKGSDVAVSITPDNGSTIQSVTINGEEMTLQNNQEFTETIASIADNITIQVDYSLKTYSVSFNDYQNGTVTDAGNQPVEGGAISVKHGSDATFTVTPNEGYHIDSIKVDGAAVALPEDVTSSTQSYTHTISNVTGNRSVEVNFAINSYILTFVYNSEEGDVKNQETHISNGGTVVVAHGENPTFKVVPKAGFHIKSITFDGKPISLPEDVTQTTKEYEFPAPEITKDQEVKIVFAINIYKVTVKTADNGEVTVNQETVEHGSAVTVTINPYYNYSVEWLKVRNGTAEMKITEGFTENDDGSYSYSVENITNDIEVEAGFYVVEGLAGPWGEYVSITETAGSLIKPAYKEGNKEIRIYSNKAKVSVAPKPEFDLVNLRTSSSKGGWGNGWKQDYTFTDQVSINEIKVKKKGGWKSERKVNLPGDVLIVFDTKKPVVEGITLDGPNQNNAGNKDWFSGAVTISGVIDNGEQTFDGVSYSSDLDKVYYSKGSDEPVELPFDAKTHHFSFTTVDEDFQGDYKIWAVDKAGNKSDEKIVSINIDKTKPALADGRSVKVELFNDDALSEFLNKLTFGMFFKKGIKVTADAKDDASGVQKMSLIAKPVNLDDKQIVLDPEAFESKGKTAAAIFILNEESFEGTFSVKITDNVNNSATVDVTEENINPEGKPLFMIDRTKPTGAITVTPANGEKPYIAVHEASGKETEFYSQDVLLDVKAEDKESGVGTVEIGLNGKNFKSYDFSNGEEKQANPVIDTIDTKTLKDQGRYYDVEAAITDNAGNLNEEKLERTIYIDENPPVLDGGKESVTFEQDFVSTFAKVIHYLSFGTFFNKQIIVTVKVKDDASGVKDIKLHANSENPSDEKVVPELIPGSFEKQGLAAEAKFAIDTDYFKGTFEVETTDNVNNQKTELVSGLNSNIESQDHGVVMIEKAAPTIDINIAHKDAPYLDEEAKEFYNGEVTFDGDVQDADSGVNAVKIHVNGSLIDEYYFHDGTASQTRPDLTAIDTGDPRMTRNEDGSYHILIEAVDNAGNASQAEKTIYIDETNPEITDFSFSTADQNENATETLKEAVELTQYGFYFKKPVVVTVKAEDPAVAGEATSKVKEMTLYLQDHENGKYYAVLADGSLKEINADAVEAIEPIPTTGEVQFHVPASFKGQMFAKAADHVNNTGEFETPDGTVIEDDIQHGKETHIAFEKAETNYRDNSNLELYPNNVDVKLTVTDTYSGLKDIEWSVEAPYDTGNNQSGKLSIHNDSSLEGDAAGWAVTKTDKNLVTEMTKTIQVHHNSNAIVVNVKMTDRSGNMSEKKLTFSIDKTAPSIQVTYDNNSSDPTHKDFYKNDRTATIVITERNFKPEDVIHAITNTDGVIPSLVGWSTKLNPYNPDLTTHTAIVKYSADGDYTFDIKYKDNAGNQAPAFAQHKFTIDKTVPVIKVGYDNNSAANGNYYKSGRTATISITEHNFDPSRVRVSGTAADGGNPASFPQISGWSARGDVHTATIRYAADGKYSFDIDFTDMAGNQAADYKQEEFIIDQTAPKLAITGVEDMSANKGDVIPVITYSDTNFNKNAVSIKLEGANRGDAGLIGSFADTANGQVYTFKNFEKKKEVDDLYTLTASLTDFAGNVSTQTIRFSVNRFGSVYVFDDSLKKMEGKYVQQEQDVILTETNVDSLKVDSIKLKMTKNGSPADLVRGTDYSVTESGGGGTWSQYRYVVKKELFASDGKYTVALYSEDAAGNINENIDENKKAEISFGIDKTAPVIVPIDIESGKQYPVDKKTATVTIKDNLVLEGAEIYVDNKKVDHEADGENFTFEIQNSNSKQNVRIIAVDAAGNELTTNVDDILVSTNVFVRWYNNTPLFMGSIGGVGGLGIAAAAVYVLRSRQKPVDVEE